MHIATTVDAVATEPTLLHAAAHAAAHPIATAIPTHLHVATITAAA